MGRQRWRRGGGGGCGVGGVEQRHGAVLATCASAAAAGRVSGLAQRGHHAAPRRCTTAVNVDSGGRLFGVLTAGGNALARRSPCRGSRGSARCGGRTTSQRMGDDCTRRGGCGHHGCESRDPGKANRATLLRCAWPPMWKVRRRLADLATPFCAGAPALVPVVAIVYTHLHRPPFHGAIDGSSERT